MKSTSEFLEAEQAAHAVRWELPRLGGKGGGAPPTARQLEEVERGAFQEGFERGRAEGYAAGMAQAQKDLAQLRRILDHFSRPLAEVSGELEQIIVHLATAVAGALARAHSAREPELIASLVREALRALPSAAREIEIQLHPDDVALVQALLTERDPSQRLTANPMLARGDVRVHSDLVRLDATLPTRLANAAEALLAK